MTLQGSICSKEGGGGSGSGWSSRGLIWCGVFFFVTADAPVAVATARVYRGGSDGDVNSCGDGECFGGGGC